MSIIFINLIFISTQKNASAQCEIEGKLDASGIMYYYADLVKVFWTSAKSLHCGAFTDDASYYLQFYPTPFPAKSKKKFPKDIARVELSNGDTFELEFFDSRYTSNDTVFVMQFLLPDESLDEFISHEISKVTLNLVDQDGLREYKLKLHKDAIKEQLECLFKHVNENKKE